MQVFRPNNWVINASTQLCTVTGLYCSFYSRYQSDEIVVAVLERDLHTVVQSIFRIFFCDDVCNSLLVLFVLLKERCVTFSDSLIAHHSKVHTDVHIDVHIHVDVPKDVILAY